MRFIFAAIVAAAVLATAAIGFSVPGRAAAPACESFKADVAKLKSSHPEVRVIELTAAQRAVATRVYNAAEPVTHYAFSHIYSIPVTGTASTIVVFIQGRDCVKDAVPLTNDEFELMLGTGA